MIRLCWARTGTCCPPTWSSRSGWSSRYPAPRASPPSAVVSRVILLTTLEEIQPCLVYTHTHFLALISNIARTVTAQQNNFVPSSLTETEVTLLGISRAIEVIVDAILVGSSAQYVIAGPVNWGQKKVQMTASYSAIALGQFPFILIIFIFNGFLLVFFVYQAIRTRGWRESTRFDYRDPKTFIVTASVCGDKNCSFLRSLLMGGGQSMRVDPYAKARQSVRGLVNR